MLSKSFLVKHGLDSKQSPFLMSILIVSLHLIKNKNKAVHRCRQQYGDYQKEKSMGEVEEVKGGDLGW